MDNMAGMNVRTVIENTLFMFWNSARHIRLRFSNFYELPFSQRRLAREIIDQGGEIGGPDTTDPAG